MRRTIYEFATAEIRKYDAEIPIALSTESADKWRDLGPRLGFTASNYVCSCGPQVTPGLRKLTANPWQTTQAVGVDEE